MEYEIRLIQTQEMFNKRIKVYMRPYLEAYAWYVGLPTITLLLCLATGEFVKNTAGTLILGLLLGCSLTQIVIYAYQYKKAIRAFLTEAELWRDKEVVYEIAEEAIAICSPFGREILPWHSVKTLRAGALDWYFFGAYSRQAFGISTDALSDEVKAFIKQKVAVAGGEVYNR